MQQIHLVVLMYQIYTHGADWHCNRLNFTVEVYGFLMREMRLFLEFLSCFVEDTQENAHGTGKIKKKIVVNVKDFFCYYQTVIFLKIKQLDL